MSKIFKLDSERVFKNASGAWLLKPLFYEYTTDGKDRVLYTMKTEDHEVVIENDFGEPEVRVYPSLRRLYMEMGDESEFLFAQTYFGGWPHWKRLLTCSWFLDHLSEIREELAARNAAENLIAIRSKAKDGNFQANKYLLEQGWKPKGDVGRPTKDRIRREAEKLSKNDSEVHADFERVSQEILSKGSFN